MAIVSEHLGQQTKRRSTSEATFQHPLEEIVKFHDSVISMCEWFCMKIKVYFLYNKP